MNQQREIIYEQRRRVLMGENLQEYVSHMRDEYINDLIESYCGEGVDPKQWDLEPLAVKFSQVFLSLEENPFEGQHVERMSRDEISVLLKGIAQTRYAEKESYLDEHDLSMRDAEREVLLRVVDMHWTDHIDAMDQLRDGIGLQAYGQRDPAREYAVQGFDMFEEMVTSINETTLNALYHITVQATVQERKQASQGQAVAKAAPSAAQKMSESSPTQKHNTGEARPFVADKKVGRNDPCPCGSGKKYKNCHGRPGMDSDDNHPTAVLGG